VVCITILSIVNNLDYFIFSATSVVHGMKQR